MLAKSKMKSYSYGNYIQASQRTDADNLQWSEQIIQDHSFYETSQNAEHIKTM